MLSHLSKVWSLSLLLLSLQAYAADSVIRITKDNFDEVLAQTDKPLIIDVFAVWCGPCKQLRPIFHEFAKNNEGRFVCADIDADESKELAASLGVAGLPTVLVYQNKTRIGKIVGFKDAKAFKAAIDDTISTANKKITELSKEQLSAKLQEALHANSLEEVKKYVAAGAEVNGYFPDGMNPLLLALMNAMRATEKTLPIIEYLIDAGASLTDGIVFNGKDTGVTPRNHVTQVIDHSKRVVEEHTKILALIDAKLEKQKSADKAKSTSGKTNKR